MGAHESVYDISAKIVCLCTQVADMTPCNELCHAAENETLALE